MPDPRRWYRRFFGLESPRSDSRRSGEGPQEGHGSQGDNAGEENRRRAQLAGAGVELAAGVLLFAGLGFLIDRSLGTGPWLLVTGSLLGLAAGMYLLIKAVNT